MIDERVLGKQGIQARFIVPAGAEARWLAGGNIAQKFPKRVMLCENCPKHRGEGNKAAIKCGRWSNGQGWKNLNKWQQVQQKQSIRRRSVEREVQQVTNGG